jgi:hypothetical protein
LSLITECGNGENQMADDFKITIQKSDEGLALELTGRFDRNSAKELLKLIRTKHSQVSRFYLDTQGLKHANPVELILDEWSQWDPSHIS